MKQLDNWVFHGILMVLAMLVGLGVRLHGLSLESATGDEVFTVSLLGSSSLSAFLEQSAAFDPTARLAPAYGIVAYVWAQLFGSGLLAARALTVLLSVGCIPLVYALGLRLAGGWIPAFAGALLSALSLPGVFYGQDLRFYALFQFLSLISMVSFARAVETNGKGAWVLNLLANAAMLWTHSFAPLFWLCQGLFLICFRRRPMKHVAMWGLCHALLLGLLALWLARLGYSPESEAAPYQDRLAGWREVGAAWLMFAGGRFSEENPAAYLPGGFSMDILLGAALVVACLRLMWYTTRNREEEPHTFQGTILLGLWLGVPLVALYLFSLEWRMVFYPRYIVYCTFPASLLLAVGATRGLRSSAQAVLALVIVGISGVQTLSLPRPFRADYQAAARDINQDRNPAVHALKPFNARAAAYALGIADYRSIENWGLPELCAETAAQAKDGRVVWVLFHRWARIDDFESSLSKEGIEWIRHEYAGMPPLIGYRVQRTSLQ